MIQQFIGHLFSDAVSGALVIFWLLLLPCIIIESLLMITACRNADFRPYLRQFHRAVHQVLHYLWHQVNHLATSVASHVTDLFLSQTKLRPPVKHALRPVIRLGLRALVCAFMFLSLLWMCGLFRYFPLGEYM